jgi:hypothetical protein
MMAVDPTEETRPLREAPAAGATAPVAQEPEDDERWDALPCTD